MAKQRLNIDNGLETSSRRGANFLRLEAITQYSIQLQYDILTASGVKRLHYPNLMTMKMRKWAEQVKNVSGNDICANIEIHAEIIVFNHPKDAKLHTTSQLQII